MNILVVNCGSSTVKYELLRMDGETDNKVIAKGLVERIGISGARLEYKTDSQSYARERDVSDHRVALKWVIEVLTDPEIGVLTHTSEIDAVGHRVVHGGERFTDSMVINEDVLNTIRACAELAPLNNPPNILGIEACQALMPQAPEVAVFDTAFHGTIPEYAYIYALPYEYYEKYGIRRYGFHGTSHRYVAERAARMMGKKPSELNLITCHMGGGVSFTAVRNGKSVDTSMGFTPLEGLVMGTRCGDVDPYILLYLMDKEGFSLKEMDQVLQKKSGVIGISGMSSDTRDIEEAAPTNHRAQLALDIIAYRAKKYIGAYYAILGELDGIVFTAGIGENSSLIRRNICQGLEPIGIIIDPERNTVRRKEAFINSDHSKVKVMVIPTNEELMIAIDTYRLTH
ncbi:MAG: acetate kinase [Candidatus Atribacteria bacterium]|nr:acetate kinase [Candidatus Atribacteria bacterium]